MNNGISIIVPTKNSDSTLRQLLHSISVQSYHPFEIIVVDNHSDDDTLQIARDMGANVLCQGPERSAQRNLGAKVAKYDTLLFLDSDMELTASVLQDCARAIELFDAVCIKENIVWGDNIWAKARSFERKSYFGSLYFEAARCLRKSVFFKLGGYDSNITGLEDMALQALLIKYGFRIGWVESEILHHEEGLNLLSYFKKRSHYGSTDTIFATNFPDYWRILCSPKVRLKFIFSYLNREGNMSDILSVSGLVIARLIELAVRSKSSIQSKIDSC